MLGACLSVWLGPGRVLGGAGLALVALLAHLAMTDEESNPELNVGHRMGAEGYDEEHW